MLSRSGIAEADFMRLDAKHYRVEVVNGDVRIMDVDQHAPGLLHVLVSMNVRHALEPFVRQHQLGIVFSYGLAYVLNGSGNIVRAARTPNVSFVRRERLPKNYDLRRPFPGAPDLAVEVVSPNEDPEEMLGKVNDYLRYGSEQVWVIYPEQRSYISISATVPLSNVTAEIMS